MSENPMSSARFAVLAEAYGAQIRRWPRDEQVAAALFAETERGQEILRQAAKLDVLLDQYLPSRPSPTLRAVVVRSAVDHTTRRQRLRWGFGLAGVGFAGLLAGLIVMAVLTPAAYAPFQNHDLSVGATAFGDAAPDSDSSEEED